MENREMRKTHNGFSLPKDVSFRKERMESGWAYVFEFENSDLDANADFVDSEYDYLSRESPNYRAFVYKPSHWHHTCHGILIFT